MYSMFLCFWRLSGPRGEEKQRQQRWRLLPSTAPFSTGAQMTTLSLAWGKWTPSCKQAACRLRTQVWMNCTRFYSEDHVVQMQFEKCPCILFHIELDNKSQEDDRQREPSLVSEVSDKMVCSACRCPFNNREDQVTTQLLTLAFMKKNYWCTEDRLGCHLCETFMVV